MKNKTFFVLNHHQNAEALKNNHTKLEFDVDLDPIPIFLSKI